jgi:cytochrome c-type biogenesis protein CcmH/NrfF
MDIRAPSKPLIFLVRFLVCLVSMALVLPLAGGLVYAQDTGTSSDPGKTKGYDEAEALSIDRMLMCPVCPAETIDQAQVELARQMRQVVREMLSQGASRDEILDFFVGNYGPEILGAPPKSGFNLLAWVVPATAVVAVVVVGLLVIRSMTVQGVGTVRGGGTARGADTSAAAVEAEEDLAPYLAAVDRDLGLSEGYGAATPSVAGDEAEGPTLGEGLTRDV